MTEFDKEVGKAAEADNGPIPCSGCGTPFTRTPYEIRKRHRFCHLCLAAKGRAYRARRKAEGRPVRRTYYPEYDRAYAIAYRPKRAAYAREAWRDPEKRQKIKARNLLKYAIDKGRIRRGPCEVCGSTKDVEGHHDDYTLPYSVRWLCTIHHTALHRSAPDQPALQPAS